MSVVLQKSHWLKSAGILFSYWELCGYKNQHSKSLKAEPAECHSSLDLVTKLQIVSDTILRSIQDSSGLIYFLKLEEIRGYYFASIHK